MVKIEYLNYAAIMVLAVIVSTMLIKRVEPTSSNRSFMLAVCVVGVSTVFDIFAVHLDNIGGASVGAEYFFHGGYLLTHTLSSLFYLIYLISLTDTWHIIHKSRFKRGMLVIPAVVFLAAFISNFFGGLDIYHITSEGVYCRGSHMFINYIVAAIYIIYGMVYIVRYRRLFTVKWIITLFVPSVFVIFATAIEFFNPLMILELFFNSIALLFVYINIQKPMELIDTSTGLGNNDAYEAACRMAYSNKKPLKVIMVDINNYNTLRDVLDYEGGAVVRKNVADFLNAVNKRYVLKAGVYYGHQGRFFMLVGNYSNRRIESASMDILKELNRPHKVNSIEISPKTSVCIVSSPDDFSDFSSYLRFSNNEFINVREGKLTYVRELLKDPQYRLLLNIDKVVTEAIDFGRLEVYYQPIYSIERNCFISAEALLRLHDPVFGSVSPAIFIPEAEQSGEINRIWDFVLRSVCEYIASDEFAKLKLDYIEVNLSAVQCVQENLADSILSILEKYGMNLSKISFEITETAFTIDENILKKNLMKLHDAGVRLCLDDYGTGYSNTRRIMDLPFDIVKLDKSFLEGYQREDIRHLITNTVHMLKGVGVQIVAEGVETEDALYHLKNCNCDMIQGFYFSKPLPRKAFEEKCALGVTRDGSN